MLKQKLPSLWVLIVFILVFSTANCSDATNGAKVMNETEQETDEKSTTINSDSVNTEQGKPGDAGPGAGAKGTVNDDYETHAEIPTKNNQPMTWRTYVNSKYAFRINYPTTFVTKPQDLARLSGFTPVPVASIFFMNPTMAKGNLAGIEPPDLEVRVYHAGQVNSLASWLDSVGFASAQSGTTSRPYQSGNVKGLEVCQTTMITPACSIFVLAGVLVYQLTAMTHEGEAMIQTFQLDS